MKVAIMQVESCNDCPYYSYIADACNKSGRYLDVASHLIQEWCELEDVKL